GPRRSDREELLELAELAVRQGVHRVDDECLDPAPGSGPEHVVDDRDDVGETLTRARARRQDVVAAAPGSLDRLALMAVQTKGLAIGALDALVAAKDLAAALVQKAFVDKLIDRPARFEGGVKLNDRMRPEESRSEFLVHARADLLVANHNEA